MQTTTSNTLEGIWIDIEILRDESLSLQEKVVLAIIKALDKGTGCYASNRYFADLLNVTPKRASDIIKCLITKNYITSHIENFYKRTLKVVIDEPVQEEPVEQAESIKPTAPSRPKHIVWQGKDLSDWSADAIERLKKYVPAFKEYIEGLAAAFKEVPSEWQGITQIAFKG